MTNLIKQTHKFRVQTIFPSKLHKSTQLVVSRTIRACLLHTIIVRLAPDYAKFKAAFHEENRSRAQILAAHDFAPKTDTNWIKFPNAIHIFHSHKSACASIPGDIIGLLFYIRNSDVVQRIQQDFHGKAPTQSAIKRHK